MTATVIKQKKDVIVVNTGWMIISTMSGDKKSGFTHGRTRDLGVPVSDDISTTL